MLTTFFCKINQLSYKKRFYYWFLFRACLIGILLQPLQQNDTSVLIFIWLQLFSLWVVFLVFFPVDTVWQKNRFGSKLYLDHMDWFTVDLTDPWLFRLHHPFRHPALKKINHFPYRNNSGSLKEVFGGEEYINFMFLDTKMLLCWSLCLDHL